MALHTFIADNVARCIGLELVPRPGMYVIVGNDDRVASSGVCRAATMTIGTEVFKLECYAIQWLRSLRPNSVGL